AAAKEHFKVGTKLYDLGRFEEAAKEYQAAFEAHDDPFLLFNTAQSYRHAKLYPKALFFFKAYLRRLPDAPNRKEVSDSHGPDAVSGAANAHVQTLVVLDCDCRHGCRRCRSRRSCRNYAIAQRRVQREAGNHRSNALTVRF